MIVFLGSSVARVLMMREVAIYSEREGLQMTVKYINHQKQVCKKFTVRLYCVFEFVCLLMLPYITINHVGLQTVLVKFEMLTVLCT